MNRIRTSLLMILTAGCLFTCGMGYKSPASAASRTSETTVKDMSDSVIGSFCKTIIKDDATWACMADDNSVYQINITTDYTPYDIKEMLVDDLTEKVNYLNASSFLKYCSMKTVYIKYLNADNELLSEAVLSRESTDDAFSFTTYSVNVEYLEIYNSVLKEN